MKKWQKKCDENFLKVSSYDVGVHQENKFLFLGTIVFENNITLFL